MGMFDIFKSASKTVAKSASKATLNSAVKTSVKSAVKTSVKSTGSSVTKKILRNPRTSLKVGAVAAGATYLAADQGYLGEAGSDLADNVDSTVSKATGGVINTVSKATGGVINAVGNIADSAGNSLSNKLLGVDSDTAGVILIIIFILIFTMQLGLLKFGLLVSAIIGGGFFWRKHQKDNVNNST